MLLLKLRNQLGFNSIKGTGNFPLTFIRTEITNVKKSAVCRSKKKMTLLSKVSPPTQFFPYSVPYMCTVVGQNKIYRERMGKE